MLAKSGHENRVEYKVEGAQGAVGAQNGGQEKQGGERGSFHKVGVSLRH